jgi:hypothetical protein
LDKEGKMRALRGITWSTGRLDLTNHPTANFLLTPDIGWSGDVAAFCAALSP